METPAPHLRAEVAQARREAVWVDGMSDGLVKRLRDHEEQQQVAGHYWWETPEVCVEAADYIAELEAQLEKAVAKLKHISSNKTTDELTRLEWVTHDTFTILDDCISEARTALAELEDKTDE